MNDVLSIILGGGRGTRLYPLTKLRAKPALPLAGMYRLIDIPVSNCINSGIQEIFVLTQFNSASLNRHITNTYHFSPFSNGFVQVLAAQQTNESPDWFQGTADAVRKSLWVLEPWKVRDYLVLSGDHLYRMDYRPFIEYHRSSNADATISVLPVEESQASSFGLLKIDKTGRVIDFSEKPTGSALDSMRIDTQILGLDAAAAKRTPYIASMGIYVFKREALIEMLKRHSDHNDFGKHVIPASLQDFNVRAHLYRGYWEDIGTVESFYHANLQLVRQPDPLFSFYDAEFPIYTRPRFLPPSKIQNCSIENSMVCDGCIVRNTRIHNSIIGIRSRLEEHSIIEDTLMMGSDFYQSDEERAADLAAGIPPIGVGANSVIRHAIIDKNARIGCNVKIVNRGRVENIERENLGYAICSGIVVVMKNAKIPDDAEI